MDGQEQAMTVCKKCQKVIDDEKFVAAQDSIWHCHCFVCAVCNVELSCTYYEHEDKTYCTKDFFTLFGSLCNRCGICVTGPMMSAGQQRYHPECFTCERCAVPICEGDSFALVDRSKLFCNNCFEQKKPSAHLRIITTVTLQHDQVAGLCLETKHKKKKKKRGGFMSSIFRSKAACTVAVISCPGSDLIAEDHILEVESVPMRSLSVDEVRQFIVQGASTKGCVLLTIERFFPSPKSTATSATRPADKTETHLALPDQLRPHEWQRKQSAPTVQSLSDHRLARVSSEDLCSAARLGGTEVSPESERRVSLRKALSLASATDLGDRDSRSADHSPKTSPLPARELFNAGGCDLDDDSDDDFETNRNRTTVSSARRASVVNMSKMLKGERGRTSTLPGRVLGAGGERHTVNVVNSMLCRGETFTERARSSRSVFRTNDLEFGEVLGQGFFGRAVRVVNKENGDVMVMKELMNSTAEARQNFLQEVQMMKALDHLNVMPLLGIMYRGRNLCIITEFIGGGTLSERIMDKSRELPDSLKVRYACDIAAGMAYLHASKIIHRDLTSNNCMIRTNDSVVVGDFGLAKVLAGKDIKQLKVVGSAYWMAPEMMNGKVYDSRADIFSFGIIICELIGRISADPDEMPRMMDFGLDAKNFRLQFLGQFPEQVFDVPILCCSLNPEERPLFSTIEAYLNALITGIDSGVYVSLAFNQFVKGYEATPS